MESLVHQVLDLLKKKQISRDAARTLLESVQSLPAASEVDQEDKRIAVIGISAELPGAKTFEDFWQVLENCEDRVGPLPSERRALCDDYVQAYGEKSGIDPANPFWHAAWIDDVDKFDPHFFNIVPAEARAMDPQQRRFLQTAYKCFEDAGYAGTRMRDSKTGVYVSAAMANYADMLNEFTPQSVPGNVPAFVASRVAYLYNLRGPSYVVNSTCASSLLALHEACLGLLHGDCDQALVGGVSVFPYPVNAKKMFMNAAGIMSEDMRCRPFDNNGGGIGRGEGVVAVLLKPLKKALEDKDNIHAVILGSAINNDGASASITAPNPQAHTELLLDAWRRAGISPEELDYLEAHGTGTHLGDPIEIKGITDAVRKTTDKRQFLALGSIKGNIGHLLDGVAGLSGLIKSILVLKHGVVPPTKYLDEPNRHIDFLDSPVFVPTMPHDLREAKGQDASLKAAVSCFGFNGTNVHVVVEEAPKTEAAETADGVLVYPISARSLASLSAIVGQYAAEGSLKGLNAFDAAYTMWSGREHFEHRVAIVASSLEELQNICRDLAGKPVDEWAGTAVIGEGTVFAEEAVSGALAREYAGGKVGAWHKLFGDVKARKVSLPTYQFDEQSYWHLTKANGSATGTSAGSKLEQVLAIARDVLEIPDLQAEDNFLEMGGDSLSGLQVVSRLKKIGADLSLEDLLMAEDFRTLADSFGEEGDGASDVEAQVLAIVREVLEIEDLQAEDNFLAMGGDSLSGLQVLARLKKQFSNDVTLEELLMLPDFKSLAEKIANTAATQESHL